jgi:hypothetical protein
MSATFLEPVSPGPERLRRFRDEGFFATAPILTPEECEAVIAEYDRVRRVIAVGSDEQASLAYQPMMHLKSPLLQRYAADRQVYRDRRSADRRRHPSLLRTGRDQTS